MAEIHDRYIRRQEELLASARKVRSSIETLNKDVGAFKRLERSPPPYVTPPSSNIMQSEAIVHPNAPRLSQMRTQEAESERTSYVSDPTGQTYGRMVYSRVPAGERFTFTPVANSPLPKLPDTPNDSS